MPPGSWANVLKADAPSSSQQTAAPPSGAAAGDGPATTAVVDANAIINGIRFDRMASKVVTIPEVLQEVRDKQSRAFMASLPFGIDTQEPAEASSKAVINFARLTGDIHVLSAVDLKLLALAHTLEVAAYGSSHLRERPVQVKVKTKTRRGGRQLPGWGHVSNPQDWKVVDEAPDEPTTNGTGSRIAMTTFDGLPSLDAAPSAAAAPASASGAGAAAESAGAAGVGVDAGPGTAAAAAAAGSGPGAQQLGSEHGDGWGEEDEEEGEEDEWATVGKSRNAERRRRRKQAGWEAREEERRRLEAEAKAGTSAAAPRAAPVAAAGVAGATAGATAADATAGVAAAGVAALSLGAGEGTAGQQGQARQQAEEGEEGESEGESEEDADEDDYGEVVEVEDSEEGEGEEEGEEEEEEEGSTVAGDGSSVAPSGTGTAASRRQQQEEEYKPNTTSSVLCITADFAMQNVLLQMGLRLVSREGAQITRLSRWALRCHACFHVTKDASKLFCPRCGNATMERVEVSVGPDGAEFFGVRKKYCLKGTRFSLPKPKGGRAGSSNPILSEDMFMLRMGKKLRRKERKAAAADAEDGIIGDASTIFSVQQMVAGGDKGTQYMMTSWKNNPNERKYARSNRRG